MVNLIFDIEICHLVSLNIRRQNLEYKQETCPCYLYRAAAEEYKHYWAAIKLEMSSWGEELTVCTEILRF